MNKNIMTKVLPFGAFLAACVGVASCSQENEDGLFINKDGGVTFTASLKNSTRASETAFDMGDAISVYAMESSTGETIHLLPSGNFADNVRYEYNGHRFESENPIIKEEGQSLAYAAIYPYSEANGPEFDFTIHSDQSEYNNYTASDLCTVITDAQEEAEVDLKFSHRLSQLRLNISGFNIAGLLNIKVVNALLTAKADLNANTFTADENGSRGEIIPYADGTNSYKIILPPQSVAPGDKVLEVSLNGRVFEIASPSALEFKSGKEYELNVSLVNGQIVIGEGDIRPWDEGQAEEEFSENFFSVENGEFVNETFVPGTDASDPFSISANQSVLAGGMNFITVNCNEEYEYFEVSVKGQEGFWKVYPEVSSTRANYSYSFTLYMGTELQNDIDAQICGCKSDGSKTVGNDMSFNYVESMSGDLNINLTFSTPKDVDLHLYTPDGQHIYFADRGGSIYVDGEYITYGLDHDSNAGCYLDYLNNENIYIPEQLIMDGEYTVAVNLWENCNTSYNCEWTVAARYKGELVYNELNGHANPVSGVYANHAAKGDHTQVIKFTLSNTGRQALPAKVKKAQKNVKAPKLTDAEKQKIKYELF